MSGNEDNTSSASPTQRRWQDRVSPTQEELWQQAEKAFGQGYDAAGRRLAERAASAPSSFVEREEARSQNKARNIGPDSL